MAFSCDDQIICACQKVSLSELDDWVTDNPLDKGETFESYLDRLTFNTFACSGCDTCRPTVQAMVQNVIDGKAENDIMEGVVVENADS